MFFFLIHKYFLSQKYLLDLFSRAGPLGRGKKIVYIIIYLWTKLLKSERDNRTRHIVIIIVWTGSVTNGRKATADIIAMNLNAFVNILQYNEYEMSSKTNCKRLATGHGI